MAFTNQWDETTPPDTGESVSLGAQRIREFKSAIRERADVDHNAPQDENGVSDIWKHKQVSFIDRTDDTGDNKRIYTKSGDLYFKDGNGNVIQLSKNGEINIIYGASRHQIVRGFGITYATSNSLYVEPGTLYHDLTEINKTARTTLTLTSDADWISGSQPASLVNIWAYVYVDANGNIKLDTNAPNRADTDGNTAGKLIYYYDGANYWRWVGQVWTDGSGNIIKFYQMGDWILYDEPRVSDLQGIDVTNNVSSWTAASFAAKGMPATSQLIKLHCLAIAVNVIYCNFRATGSSATDGIEIRSSQYYTNARFYFTVDVPTDSSQSLDYKAFFDNEDFDVYCAGYYAPRN